MTENEVSKIVLDCAIKVHRDLGPGLLESVYEAAMAHLLRNRGLRVETQFPVPVEYEGVRLDVGFRIDILVDHVVIVEIKSVESLPPVAFKIVLTYLRLTGKRLGLLINFSQERLMDGYHRVVNGLQE